MPATQRKAAVLHLGQQEGDLHPVCAPCTMPATLGLPCAWPGLKLGSPTPTFVSELLACISSWQWHCLPRAPPVSSSGGEIQPQRPACLALA